MWGYDLGLSWFKFTWFASGMVLLTIMLTLSTITELSCEDVLIFMVDFRLVLISQSVH